ncbi:MAG TPA: M28 family peptidase [Gemmatimonadales bacterium]|nr:M28 family peptidase [Gemmatimonadales bacterium]
MACQARAGSGSASAATREFNGRSAFSYVEQQMAFGPRIPNTLGAQKTGDWLLTELRARADTVIVQNFQQRTSKGKTLQLRNFFARFRPQASDRVLFLAHWDTRPFADKSQNLGQQRMPVPGANDGASGVAVLLGLADALKAKAPAIGVDLLFVDGEDYGDFSDTTETLLGARYFAKHQPPGYTTLFAVLFDMVGDKDLDIQQEGFSLANAPEVVQRVWQTADRLGYGRIFQARAGQPLTDDHVPLQQAGIRAIDVIDFDFPFHHTTEDTIDKVSAESLQIVGDVAVALVRQ